MSGFSRGSHHVLDNSENFDTSDSDTDDETHSNIFEAIKKKEKEDSQTETNQKKTKFKKLSDDEKSPLKVPEKTTSQKESQKKSTQEKKSSQKSKDRQTK